MPTLLLLLAGVLVCGCVTTTTTTTVFGAAAALSINTPRRQQRRQDTTRRSSTVWKHAAGMDYSAANEYVRAHYGIEHYFFSSSRDESIYDARLGYWNVNEEKLEEEASLETSGFTLIKEKAPKVTDFSDADQVKSLYLPQLRHEILPRAFAANDGGGSDGKIADIFFWHPMYRGEDQVIIQRRNDDETLLHEREKTDRLPTASIAPLVHIDTDVGAYESLEDIARLVANNRFDDEEQNSFDLEQLVEKLLTSTKQRRRFAICNIWRNANLEQPIRRAPLALLSTQYGDSSQNKPRRACFPDARPDSSKSKWYIYPDMTADECLVVKQYDRHVQKPSDIWHCSLPSIQNGSSSNMSSAAPRRSFDVRALVIFDECLEPENDRFSDDRTRPSLSHEESGCFCERQAAAEADKVERLLLQKQPEDLNE